MKRKHFAYIAAGLLALNAICHFINALDYLSIMSIMVDIVPLIILAIILIAINNNKTISGIAILIFAVLKNLLLSILISDFSIYTIITIINEVLLVVGLLVDWKRYRINFRKYSWIFIVLPILYIVLIFIRNFNDFLEWNDVYWWAFGVGDWWRTLLGAIIRCLNLTTLSYVGWHIFLGLYVCYKPKKKAKASATHDYSDVDRHNSDVNGYISMGKHIVLCLFTFGIWYLIWIYRTTAYLNRAPDSEEYSPTSKLLLCMFVPFYIIFWLYKHGQRIDRLAKANNVDSDIATLSLIMGIFIPIVAVILMQDKINTICIAAARKNHATPVNEAKAVVSQNIIAETASEANGEKASARDQKDNTAPYEEIKQLKELLDRGIITQEEFNMKKKELLGL